MNAQNRSARRTGNTFLGFTDLRRGRLTQLREYSADLAALEAGV
jgi:hypothetical protein